MRGAKALEHAICEEQRKGWGEMWPRETKPQERVTLLQGLEGCHQERERALRWKPQGGGAQLHTVMPFQLSELTRHATLWQGPSLTTSSTSWDKDRPRHTGL